MARMPAADLDVTPGLVRRLLEAQHPDLADLPLRHVANGWDNVMLRLGETLAVRLPRRAASAELVRHEQRWLPELGPLLGVAVPTPVRVGTPGAGFPWPWSVVPWFSGRIATDLAPADRGTLAAGLASMIARLHLPAPAEAPVNPYRGVPLASRDSVVRARLDAVGGTHLRALTAEWDAALAVPPWTGPPVWLHGDLHPRNLLLTATGELAAVLDFGDLTSGDPATDLACAWLSLDAADRRTFRAEVTRRCGTDDATWSRARGWAVAFGVSFLATSDDDPVIAAIGTHAVAQLVADRPG